MNHTERARGMYSRLPTRRTRRLAIPIFAGLLLAVTIGCRSGEPANPDVVATTSIVGALAKAIAGETLTIATIVSAGVDPHEYEASPDDASKIGRAKLVLRNGIGIDASLDRVIAASGQKVVVTVTDRVVLSRSTGGKREDDPHVWHDPANAKIMVDNIAKALSAAFPDRADTYAKNAADYNVKLDAVDAEIAQLIATIPPANRKLVTNHDALGYFINRYGLTYVGAVMPSISSTGEPSAKETAVLQETIKREGVKAVFAESSIDPKVAREIAKDTRIAIVDDLYGDSLGKKGSEADTVDKMLLVNARKIATALR